jgi:hypothetical protein
MTKKIFALVMVVSVLGACLAVGCGKKDDAGDSTSAGATKDTGAAADTTKTTS